MTNKTIKRIKESPLAQVCGIWLACAVAVPSAFYGIYSGLSYIGGDPEKTIKYVQPRNTVDKWGFIVHQGNTYLSEDGSTYRVIVEPSVVEDKNIKIIRPAHTKIEQSNLFSFSGDKVTYVPELASLEGKIVGVEERNVACTRKVRGGRNNYPPKYFDAECQYQAITVRSGDKNYTLTISNDQRVWVDHAEIEFELAKDGLVPSKNLIAPLPFLGAPGLLPREGINVKADGMVKKITYKPKAGETK